jgi:hypothetical protein
MNEIYSVNQYNIVLEINNDKNYWILILYDDKLMMKMSLLKPNLNKI